MNLNRIRAALFLLLAAIVAAPSAFAAADVVTVGTVTASGNTVDVPVYVRDVSLTPLGVDQPPGSKIQSFSITVTYSPASVVSSVTFSRAGITAALAPTLETSPPNPPSISWLATFQESTSPVPFTLNKTAPGDQVAHLVFTLNGTQVPGSQISLTLGTANTQLTNQAGTTKETTGNNGLTLVNGAINIPPLTLSIAPSSQNVAPGAKAFFTAVASAAVPSATTVTLASSNTSIATVPASVTINAGSTSANFSVTGVAVGHATITGTLPNSATAQASVNVAVPTTTCTTPEAPLPAVSASVATGVAYDVTWPLVPAATEYFVEESTSADFTDVTSVTVTDPHATFTHSVSTDTRYYYRVTARNRSTGCDVSSAASAAVSVLVGAAAPLPQLTRYLAVAGSTAGSLGSYFKTSVQLYNAGTATVTGKFIFHTAGQSGSASDPSMTYALAPAKTLVYADLLPAMGIASGLGTVDIVGDPGSALPLALVRVFNDAGAGGTTGLTEEAFKAEEALQQGQTAVLQAPTDVTRFRMNVGVRTLGDGATLNLTVRDKDGVVVKTISGRNYVPTYFAQPSAAGFLDGYALTGGETITIAVSNGSVLLYGSTTDNTTQDPSVQFAKKIE